MKQHKIYNRRTVLLNFKLPGNSLINSYEEKKHNFLKKEYDEYLTQARLRENSQIKDFTINQIIGVISKDPTKYTIKGRISMALIKANLGISHHKAQDISVIMNNANK